MTAPCRSCRQNTNNFTDTDTNPNENTTMSANESTNVSSANNQIAARPMDLNDDNSRRDALMDAMGTDSEDDMPTNTAANTESTANKSPPAETPKSKAPIRNPMSRFKSNRSASQVSAPSGNANANRQVNPSDNTNVITNTTKPTPTIVNANMTPSKIQVEGSNIGSSACEPEWTTEQLQHFATLSNKRLGTTIMADTRRSVSDPERMYVTTASDGSVLTRPAAILPVANWDLFKLGLGKVKPDEKTGKNKVYSDVVMKGSNWLLNQWTSRDVVIETVPDAIMNKPPRIINGKPERRIGYDFARIGLPKASFLPIFETLKASMPSLMEGVSITDGYYWLNASWGVTGSPGNFIYKGKGNAKVNTFKLNEAIRMLGNMSSIGVACVAISVANETKLEGGKLIPDPGKYELSIKIHNMFHIKKVNYHSPPQAGATGFEVSDDIFGDSEVLEQVSGMDSMFSNTAGSFNNVGTNPFFGVNAAISNNAPAGSNSSGLLV